MFLEVVDTDIDYELLHHDLAQLLRDHDLSHHDQISLTSIDGQDDWLCSVGRISELARPEKYYGVLNRSLQNTSIETLLNRYPEYYRWRLLRLRSKTTYSIHCDSPNPNIKNYRLHVPVVTNSRSFLMFYPEFPRSGHSYDIRFEHLELGNSYRVDTTGLHTAINHGDTDRYHIVGVRYEKL
jgi:hypothetical protein